MSNIKTGLKLNSLLIPERVVVLKTERDIYIVVVGKNAIDDLCCSCECTFVELRVPNKYVQDLRIDWHQYHQNDQGVFVLKDGTFCPPRFNGEVVKEIYSDD